MSKDKIERAETCENPNPIGVRSCIRHWSGHGCHDGDRSLGAQGGRSSPRPTVDLARVSRAQARKATSRADASYSNVTPRCGPVQSRPLAARSVEYASGSCQRHQAVHRSHQPGGGQRRAPSPRRYSRCGGDRERKPLAPLADRVDLCDASPGPRQSVLEALEFPTIGVSVDHLGLTDWSDDVRVDSASSPGRLMVPC
jgi:hypothetical protein